MVFNSYEFLFLFLPAAYLGFLFAHRIGGWPLAYVAIAVASGIFYAQLGLALLTILCLSVLGNFFMGRAIIDAKSTAVRKGLMILGVIANIATLGYFKYTNFAIDIVNSGTGAGFSHLDLLLPIGISFYTFIQIGYLIECYSGQAGRQPFSRYAVFAAFFPCVTAGPLVLQKEIFGQMGERKDRAFCPKRLATGLTMFGMGLFKKVVLADTMAPFANAAFDSVAGGASIGAVDAWLGALAYTLQLYFDFSGYTDMAIGLGYMFGIKLPLNFNSPFKATSISDFWRRWHMTMTRFFTTYLYTPMAMGNMRRAVQNGHGAVPKFAAAVAWPMIFTFLIAGIWHGAGWTFVVYGLIHGFALAINHGWREFKLPAIPPVAGWFLTMSVVVSGLVVFRAADLGVAGTMLASMWSFGLVGASEATAVIFADTRVVAGYIIMLGEVVLLAPNTQQILKRHWVSSDAEPASDRDQLGEGLWRPSPAWAAATAACLAVAITLIGSGSGFLYYQF